MSYHNILNNNADNFKLSVENNILYTKYNNINLFELSVNSNISYKNIAAPSYLFLNSSSGFIYNNTNSNISINANKTILNCDVKINGSIDVGSFVNNVVLFNQYNKIDWNYIPTIANTVTYNTLINVPADIINTTGRLGLGVSSPSCICHVNKNDDNFNIPVFSATTNSNIHVFDIFAEKKCVTINNSNGNLENSNIKLNVYGLTKTSQINVGNVFTVDENTEILNDLYVNNIKSRSNIIYIHSNTDLNINNFSLKTHTSNLNLITNCFKVQENKLLFNNDLSFNFNNNKIIIKNSNNEFIINSNNILCDNLIVSNLTLINTQKFTSNPYVESIIDIYGKIKLLSDSEYTVNNIYINNSNLFFTTINSNLFNYNIQTSVFLNISNNFNYDIFKSKYNSYGFYYNNILNINNNSLIINEPNIKDFTFNNEYLYYLNSNGNIISYNLNTNISDINIITNITKIDSYYNNHEYVYLNNNNELFYYNLNNLTNKLLKINFNNNNLKIIDFSCGYNHTLVLFENNTLYSFGIDNYLSKGGFNGNTSINLIPTLISNNSTIINKKIVKIKANWNNSIILDDNGLVYVFGAINFNTNFIIYNLINIPPIIDFCCNEYSVFLLSKYNDIYNYKYNNLTDSRNALNTKINIFELPDNFYGTSIKSKGSIVIGGDNFNKLIPKNSLLVNNCIYIGSNINTFDKLITSNYSLIVSGDINIIGSIYNNGVLFKGSSEGTFNNSGSYNWINQNNYNIYYNGNVGIGVSYPNKKLHVNGEAIFESNIYVNGTVITNEYKPWKLNNKSIYEYNKIGINIKNPDANLHLYDGNFKITGINLLNNSNNLILSNIQINSVTQNTYKNRIAISQNGLTIVSTYNNSYYKTGYNNVFINKFINNTWNNYTFTKNNITDITYYGNSIAITENGNTIFIGAHNDAINNSLGGLTYTGGIYVYNFINNEFKKRENNLYYTVLSNTIPTYIKIGKTICCSTDGNIIISDFYDNITLSPYKLLKKIIDNSNLNQDVNILLDFSYYQFYGTFNFNNNDNLILDCSFDSSIIIANFQLNAGISYSNFIYYNFYIYYNNNIYLVFFKDDINANGNGNANVNSISISNDGDKIFITNVNGNYYLLNLNFNNILNTIYANQYNINYLNLEILYKGTLPQKITNEIDYRGKIAKSGNSFTLYSNKKIINYKFDFLNNIWNSHITNIDNINNLNDFNIDCDFNAYNYAVGYICNNYNNTNDNITITNNLLKIYNEIDIINANNLKVNINTDAYINKIFTNDIIGYGSNLSNIELSNIKHTSFIEGGILYSKNNKIIENSNLIWDDINSNLNIKGNINCSLLSGLFNLSNAVSILSLNNGGLGNSNFNENQILFASNSNITGNNNFKWDNNSNKLEIIGNLQVNNINCSNITGDGYNLSNLYAKNITDIISLSNGGLGINNINSNEILFGNNTNSIRTTPNFKWVNDSNTLDVNGNVYATNIFGSFYGSGAGLTSIPVSILSGVANVSNGGTGLTDIKNGLIPFGHYDNAINNIKLNTSPNFLYTGTDLYVSNYVFANKFKGNGQELSNIQASNIRGKIGSNQGGIGDINIQYGNILVGTGFCNSVSISTTLNLYDSNLILNGNFYGCNINAASFIGYGSNIKSLSASNIDGILNVKNGGTGLDTCLKDKFFVGNNQNPFNILSNLEWNFTDNLLKFNCNASLIINKPIILNKFLSNLHISEIINTSNGGTGNSNYDSNTLIYYSQGKFLSSSNLSWNNDTSNFNINGNINVNYNLTAKSLLGNGYLISNLNANNLSNVVLVEKGGTGNNGFISGNLLIGNGLSPISSTSQLNWDYANNKLNILNGNIGVSNVYASNLYGNGENISNINVNKFNGIISLNNGGLGTNLIGSNELLIGNNSNAIKSDSNIKWISQQKQLLINGNINAFDIICSNLSGNGININNLNVNNLNGTITVNNGGTGKNNHNIGEILVGNNDGPITSYSSLKWDNLTLTIGGNIITTNITAINNIIGNGFNITNLNTNNLTGLVSVNKGGTGINSVPSGSILFGSSTTNILDYSTSFKYDKANNRLGIGKEGLPLYTLDINGDLNFNGTIYKNGSVFTGEKDFNVSIDSNTLYTYKNLYIGYSNEINLQSQYDSNYKCKIDGNMYVTGDITGLSDRRFKNNISIVDNSIEKIKQINGVYYNLNNKNDLKRHIGLIAQDVEKIIPEAVYTNVDDTKSIAYGNMMGLVVESIKSIITRLENLENNYIKNLY
jgi:hypothetical protein